MVPGFKPLVNFVAESNVRFLSMLHVIGDPISKNPQSHPPYEHFNCHASEDLAAESAANFCSIHHDLMTQHLKTSASIHFKCSILSPLPDNGTGHRKYKNFLFHPTKVPDFKSLGRLHI